MGKTVYIKNNTTGNYQKYVIADIGYVVCIDNKFFMDDKEVDQSQKLIIGKTYKALDYHHKAFSNVEYNFVKLYKCPGVLICDENNVEFWYPKFLFERLSTHRDRKLEEILS